jgi:uncharacterized phosphosugar-binding protein
VSTPQNVTVQRFHDEVVSRLREITDRAEAGEFDVAVALIADAVKSGGVIQAFGTGHSESFSMEIAGRAGGFIPSHAMFLRDLVLLGDEADPAILAGPGLERDADVAGRLWSLYDIRPADVFLIASNSGVNGSIVEMALRAKAAGHSVIAVTSLRHSMAVEPKHQSGKRLGDVADVTIDNRAPFGDATIAIEGAAAQVGAVSSITSAHIAQILAISAAEQLALAGVTPPTYVSSNVPGGDDRNAELRQAYGARIEPYGTEREHPGQ